MAGTGCYRPHSVCDYEPSTFACTLWTTKLRQVKTQCLAPIALCEPGFCSDGLADAVVSCRSWSLSWLLSVAPSFAEHLCARVPARQGRRPWAVPRRCSPHDSWTLGTRDRDVDADEQRHLFRLQRRPQGALLMPTPPPLLAHSPHGTMCSCVVIGVQRHSSFLTFLSLLCPPSKSLHRWFSAVCR